MRDTGETPLLPRNPAPYLVEWLLEIGPDIPAGFGSAAIGFRDIVAWQDITGVELLPWEARLLRFLSKAWVSERSRASKQDAAPPYAGETADDIKDRREAVDRKIDAMFRSMKKKS